MSVSRTTSRVGRKPIIIPSGVEVKLQNEKLAVKGPKGSHSITLNHFVRVTVGKDEITVHADSEKSAVITGSNKKLYRSIAGTERANINNAVHGVTRGFERKLVLVGVGYRAAMKGKVLSLSLGFSHPTDYPIPEGIVIETPIQTEIYVKGVSKKLVGQVAAEIRAIRSPEPYKGKGVRYADEVVVIKETKKK